MTEKEKLRKAIRLLIGASLFMTLEESDAVNVVVDYIEKQLKREGEESDKQS